MGTHLAQANDRNGLIFMASVFVVVSITMVSLRLYCRRHQRLSFKSDDWCAVAGTVLVLGLNGLFIAGTAQSVITGHSPIENDWPVSTETEHAAERYKYGFQVTEKFAFGLLKISVILLWRRIFGQVRSFNIFCWVMIGVVTAWSTAFAFGTIFQCGTEWWLNFAPIGMFLTECSNTLDMLTAFAATDIITDLIIMLMPVPMIWSLQMAVRKKLAITGMFTVGLFVIGAGIARLYIYLVTSYEKESNPDFIADFTLFILWSDIEANVAVVSANLPTLLPVLTKAVDGWRFIERSRMGQRLLSTMRLSRSTLHPSSWDMSQKDAKTVSSVDSVTDRESLRLGEAPRLETSISGDRNGNSPLVSYPIPSNAQRIMVHKNIYQNHE